MSHCAGELMFRDHRARPPGNQQPSGLYLLLWGPLVHVGCHTALVPPPMCDGAGGPRGQLTSRHHPHCSVCGLKRPGACGKPFSLSLRRVSRSLRAGPSGQGLSRGTLKSALALKMHMCGRRRVVLLWAWELLWSVNGGHCVPTAPVVPPAALCPPGLGRCDPLTCRTGESDSCSGPP